MERNKAYGGFTDYRLASLRTFSWGQLIGAVVTFVFLALLAFTGFEHGLLLLLAGINGVTGLGACGALFLLSRHNGRAATYIFVLSTTIAISLALPIAGTENGVPATFVWPAACAAMLLGWQSGAAIASLCAGILVIEHVLELQEVINPQLQGDVAQSVGVFAALLTLLLVSIVTSVASRNVQRSLNVVEEELAERRRAEEALSAREKQFRAVFENSIDAMFIVDTAGGCVDLNPAASALMLRSKEDLLNQRIAELVTPVRDIDRIQLENCWKQETAAIGEGRLERSDGQTREIDFATIPDFLPGFHLMVFHDVTDRKHLERELTELAFHDPLTKLPNRSLFMDRLELALLRAAENHEMTVVLFLDLDEFKVINDTLGHQVGDQLLVEVGMRLRECARNVDTVARLGGDEFTILLERLNTEQAATSLASRVGAALRKPFSLNGREILVSGSIGIAVSNNGDDLPAELLRKADIAMYEAKSRGKSRFEVFDAKMSFRAWRRLETEIDLRHALEQEQFTINYQPIIELHSGKIWGAEALVRWQHPELGLISPADFIPVAEQTGLILPLGQWVLEQACRQLVQWQQSIPAYKDLTMSVNLSARQFQHTELLADIRSALTKCGLDPRCLRLEITESMAMEDVQATRTILLNLKSMGILVALDDFGTGYSSLSYLKRYPIDALKLDRSFVKDLGATQANTAIVNAIVAFARTLNLSITAEGIETAAQFALLRELDCDHGQGYYFARPMTADQFAKMLKSGWRQD